MNAGSDGTHLLLTGSLTLHCSLGLGSFFVRAGLVLLAMARVHEFKAHFVACNDG